MKLMLLSKIKDRNDVKYYIVRPKKKEYYGRIKIKYTEFVHSNCNTSLYCIVT